MLEHEGKQAHYAKIDLPAKLLPLLTFKREISVCRHIDLGRLVLPL